MATTVALTSGGDLAAAITTLDGAGGGLITLGPGTYTGGVDIDTVGGPVRIRGTLGSEHTVINGPSGANCLSVATMADLVTLEGVTLNGPTTNGFATLYGIDSAAIHLDDVVLTAGGFGTVFLNKVAGIRASRVVVRDVPGVSGNATPIGFWVFGGSGSDYLIIPDMTVQDVDGSGFVIDAGSADPDNAASTVGGQIGILRLVNCAQNTGAAGALDIQSAVDTQIAQLYIKGISSGPAAVSIKEDQYFGQADVYKPRNIQIGLVHLVDIPGTGIYLSGAQNCHIGSYIAENVDGYLVRFVGGAGGGSGGGTDHTCTGNVIDMLDHTLAPDSLGILFDSTAGAVTENTVRYCRPDLASGKRVYSGSASRTGTTRNAIKGF